MALKTGTRIGNYEIGSALGAGGAGEVYRARDLRLDREVAIKSLSQSVVTNSERLGRFEREARMLASLNHPNIGAIYGIEDVGGNPHLVLELVDGETLEERLKRGPMSVGETIEVAAQIASGIEAAHHGGIVHRDLKPGNVMLTHSGAVKVLDFGLSKSSEPDAQSSQGLSTSPTITIATTREGSVFGTAPYMSPEQARAKTVDGRTDLWALGCILFECLSGTQPFAGETMADIIARILEREPNWELLPPSVPERMRDLISRCLAKDVTSRLANITDLRAELIAIAQGLAAPPKAGATDTEAPSLAVLFFENIADDKESEYFCSGITEDILTDLSKIKGLRVASRNAVLRYRGAPVNASQACAELNVRAVLEGSVRRVSDRVRITTRLVNGADGFQLWAERYDRTLQDVFAVQEEIAASIAEALRVALSPAETENLLQDRPNDARAYDLYLKGRELYGRYDADSLNRALELFRQSIEIDSDYALAWAGIADCYGQLIQWRTALDIDDATWLGLEAAQCAIAINPALPDAYKAKALILRYQGDDEGARAALVKAIQANPRFTPALINLAVDRFDLADLAGAERLIRRVLEIDPQEAFATVLLGYLMIYTARFEQAIVAAAKIQYLSTDPVYMAMDHTIRGWSYILLGDISAAEQVIREGHDAGVPLANTQCLEALIAAREGRGNDAKQLIDAAQDSKTLGAGSLMVLASAAVLIGELDRATRIADLGTGSAQSAIRLLTDLHPLADHAFYAPRRLDATLIWPLEAPRIAAERHALFKKVEIESGMPDDDDVPEA